MKKTIIVLLTALTLSLVSCDNGNNGTSNGTDKPEEKPDTPVPSGKTYAKELWGEWLRMDTGDKWYISDNAIKINSRVTSTTVVLDKQSERVIEVMDGGRKYYLYASRNANAHFTGAIVGDAGAARAIGGGIGGIRVAIANLGNKSNELNAVTDTAGIFTAEEIIPGDTYIVTPEGGTPVTVIPANDGADVGVVTVTSGVNFKTSISSVQASFDMNELYINENYSFNLEFENVGDKDCPAPSYTIVAPDDVSITGRPQGRLGTIEPGKKENVPINIECFAVTGDYEYKKINVTITDGTGKTWEDSVSLRFYKDTIDFNIKAEKSISGIVISPDAKTYSFTDVTNKTVVVPRRSSGDYLVVFSGATIENETRYALGIGVEADEGFEEFFDTGLYEPNNTEGEAVLLNEQRIMELLYKNDIDYYRVSYNDIPFPSKPTNVTANVVDAKVTVSWDEASDASLYNVYRSDSQTGTYTKIGESTSLSYTDTVSDVGTYYYQVIAVSAGGFESTHSAPTLATASRPTAPTNVTTSVADAKVTVSWDEVSGANSYNVYRSGSQGGTYDKVGDSAAPSYIDTVSSVGTYYYRVSAVSADGFESAHSTPTLATATSPSAPINVTASAVDAKVTVSWNVVSGASSYNVYRSSSQTGTYDKIGESESPSYIDTVSSMGTYYYQVSVVSAGGFESAHSTWKSVTVTRPTAPTNVTASVADAKVTVSWDEVSGASSYNVYRSGSQTGTYTKIGESASPMYIDTVSSVGTYYYQVSVVSAGGFESAHSTWKSVTVTGPTAPTNVTASVVGAEVTVSWDEMSGASSYNVYRSDSYYGGTLTKIGESESPSYIDTVSSVGTYYYQVRVVSAGGLAGAYSTQRSVMVTSPNAPTNITASTTADNKASLSWSAVSRASSYNVYRSDSQTGTYTKIGESASPSYIDMVTVAGAYYYKVSAVSAEGFESTLSTSTVVITISSIPTNVSTNVVGAEITVSWSAALGASSYNVYRSDSQTGIYTKIGESSSPLYIDTVSIVGTYYYKVSAVSAGNSESTLSTPTSATVSSIPTNVSTSIADAEVTISWSPVLGASSYNVYRSDSSGGTYTKIGESTSLSYINTVTVARIYYYKVSAVSVDGFESTHSAPTSATVAIPMELEVTTLTDTLSWLSANAISSGHYTLLLAKDETISAQTLSYSSKAVTIILKGRGGERTVNLSDNGSLFTVGDGVTLVFDSSITIKGHSDNNASLVRVNSGGTLLLKDGAKITGNSASYGGGVYVNGGTFTMSGGTINGNTASASGSGVYVSSGTFTMSGGTINGNTAFYGGGVYVSSSGTFMMSGGTISGNHASYGDGVYVYGGTFMMNGGTISDNNAYSNGGGVFVSSSGTFTMEDGEISDNSAYNGGGVYVSSGTFTMSGGEISGNTAPFGGGVYNTQTFEMLGGTISGNTATSNGGGVYSTRTFTMSGGEISGNTAIFGGGAYVDSGGTFTKQSGGIIYGSDASGSSKNTATGGVLSYGHTVYVYNSTSPKKRNTTAGVGVTLDSGSSSGWE
jgi:fibronectin type 3 domain-containing protein